jgi:hypothetical protein
LRNQHREHPAELASPSEKEIQNDERLRQHHEHKDVTGAVAELEDGLRPVAAAAAVPARK